MTEPYEFDEILIEESIIHQQDLDDAKQEQKDLVSKGLAVDTPEIKLGGCPKRGAQLMGKIAKLILRAYDFETKDAIRDVKYNKKEAVAQKIVKLADTISKSLNPHFSVSITPAYIQCKLKQLDAYHKHSVAKQSRKGSS